MYTRRGLLQMAAVLTAPAAPRSSDWRHIATGTIIPDESYSDQPYVVITSDGNWLCVLTTGKGVEGQGGQHVVSAISTDKGKTWSDLVDIEPASGPEASWVMPLRVPSGRVYVFYTYNKDNLRQVNSNNPGIGKRVDTMGAYMFKYSDDNGRSWSRERFEIPMRNMRIDRENTHAGEVRFFWGVGKPIVSRRGYAIFGFAKVGKWGDPGAMVESQGCFLRSDNILTERDPRRIRWTLLPDGDEGLRAPKGPVSDEANLVELSDGSLYATYRTIDGYNCHAYSRDGGHTWTPPAYATYTPNGRRIKHPRAANFVRKFSNGKFLLWFHNHGGEAVHTPEWTNGRTGYYRNRNPGWICGGVERGGYIHWSQPEILLYDEDPAVRISYPDFVEDSGRFYITETQKEVARVHEIDRALLDGVWNEDAAISRNGLVVEHKGAGTMALPRLPGSFALDFWVRFRELTPGQVLLDSGSVRLTISERFTLQLALNDGRRTAAWDSDPGTHPGTLRVRHWQHVAAIVDAGPRIISFVIDGEFNDGGAARQYGWSRYDGQLGELAAGPAQVAPKLYGEMGALRLYNRYLRTAEAVAHFRAGRA